MPNLEGDSADFVVAGVKGVNTGPKPGGIIVFPGDQGAGVYGSGQHGPGVYGTGPYGVWGQSPNGDGVHGETSSAAHAGVSGTNNNEGIGVYGRSQGTGTEAIGVLGVSNGDGGGVTGRASKWVAIYGETTAATFSSIWGNNISGGRGVEGTANQSDGVHGETGSDAHAGVSGVNNGNGIGVYGRSQGGGAGVWGTSSQYDGVHGETDSDTAAGVSGTNNGNGIGVYGRSQGLDGVHGDSTSPAHAGVSGINNTDTGYGVYGQGKIAGHFNGNVEITGDQTVGGDILLPGADCAERFEVASGANIEAGTVMVISGSGNLEPSTLAYDKCVVGVVSGAGDLRPGIILGRQHRQGGVNVALVGKVFCKVDATDTPVEIGDLLTTSGRAGHAMKVQDQSKAFGCIVGKALASISNKCGFIPILIALQ